MPDAPAEKLLVKLILRTRGCENFRSFLGGNSQDRRKFDGLFICALDLGNLSQVVVASAKYSSRRAPKHS